MLNAIVLKCCSNNKVNYWNFNFSTRDFQNVVLFFFQVPIALHCHNLFSGNYYFFFLFFQPSTAITDYGHVVFLVQRTL